MTQPMVIIGAGMAGLAAGRYLVQQKLPFVILEARPHVGGRTFTDYSLDAPFDCGAAWLHGVQGNPIAPLIDQAQIALQHTDFANLNGNSVLVFDHHGREVDPVAYGRGFREFDGVLNHIYGSALYRPGAELRSFADLYQFGLPITRSLTPAEQAGFDYSAYTRLTFLDAADLDQIDWRLSGEYIGFPGGDWVLTGGGYSKLTHFLAQGLPIQLETVVSSVRYAQNKAIIQTNKGEFEAEKVLITVPLGVLQAGHIQFVPPLPAAKQQAIGRLGMGHYEKLALKFPHQFWPAAPQRFNYLTQAEPALFTSWLNGAYYTQQPILATYHAGRCAQHINQWSDEQYTAEAMKILRFLFGANIPDPVQILRTHWEQDPLAGGAYSYQKVGSLPTDRQTLAQPLHNTLFFAGEATHPHYYSTVHGAYESGLRAAQEMTKD